MKKNKLVLVLIVAWLSSAVFAMAQSGAQRVKSAATASNFSKNTFSIEGAGGQSGLGAGFSYQRFIWGNYNTFLSGSVGLGVRVSLQKNAKTVGSPQPYLNQNLTFNFGNFGGKGSYGEIGLGGMVGKTLTNTDFYSLYPMLGYRFQPSAGRVFLHLYVMPIVGESRNTGDLNDNTAAQQPCLDCPIRDSRSAIRPWGGFGAGYRF